MSEQPQEPRAPRSRARVLVPVAVSAAVLAVAAALALPPLLGTDEPRPELDDVQTFGNQNSAHVTEPEEFDQTPPVGGNHYAVWMDCGVYDEPINDMNAVHDLEHGAIWITYRPDEVDDDGVAELADALPENGIMSPYPEQEAPVVVTAWSRQLALEGPDDPRLPLFVDRYVNAESAPEPTVTCAGGLTDPAGGLG